jgi:Fe2+ transport system protein B
MELRFYQFYWDMAAVSQLLCQHGFIKACGTALLLLSLRYHIGGVAAFMFSIFVMFYFRCPATLGIMTKEIGWKNTLAASDISLTIALILGLLVRWFGILLPIR